MHGGLGRAISVGGSAALRLVRPSIPRQNRSGLSLQAKQEPPMPATLKLEFLPFTAPPKDVLIVFCDEGLKFGSSGRAVLEPAGDLVKRAAESERFKGKHGSALEIVAPAGLDVRRLVVLGVGKVKDLKSESWVKLGGTAMGKIPSAAAEATIVADLPGGAPKPERVADMAMGIRLRAYSFDRYKTKRKDDDETPPQVKVSIAVSSVTATQTPFAPQSRSIPRC